MLQLAMGPAHGDRQRVVGDQSIHKRCALLKLLFRTTSLLDLHLKFSGARNEAALEYVPRFTQCRVTTPDFHQHTIEVCAESPELSATDGRSSPGIIFLLISP